MPGQHSLRSRFHLISLALSFLIASENTVSGSQVISSVEGFVDMPFGFPAKGEPLALRPPQVALAVDNYPVAPEPLKLEQVHVYVRHGAY